MTDNTGTDDLIDLNTYTGRIEKLNFYSCKKGDAKCAEYLRIKNEIEGKLQRGEPVYVTFYDDRRAHSVGRIKSCNFRYEERIHRSYYGSPSEIYAYIGIDDIEVVWKGRSNKVKPRPNEIEYWADWDQVSDTTQWHWEQTVLPKEEPIIAYDHLGQELEVGHNVCFVHRQYGNTSMKFGTVTRFTKKGSVFVKTMKLKDGARGGEELKALSMDDVVIVNDTLMKRLVMAKLAAN